MSVFIIGSALVVESRDICADNIMIRIALCLLLAVFHSVPIIAAILSFVRRLLMFRDGTSTDSSCLQITYSLTGHDLNVAVIFVSLQFFNVSPFTMRNTTSRTEHPTIDHPSPPPHASICGV